MKKLNFLFVILFTSIISCFSQDVTYNFTGLWNTDLGMLKMTHQGNTVVGLIDDVIFIEGTTSTNKNVVTGTWVDYFDEGGFTFTLSESKNSFYGSRIEHLWDRDTTIAWNGSRQKGSIYGYILDSITDSPVVDASVELQVVSGGTATKLLEVKSDDDGFYETPDIYTGAYIIRVSHPFFNIENEEMQVAHYYLDGQLDYDAGLDVQMSIIPEKPSVLYGEEIRLEFQLRDMDSVLIEGNYQVQFSEIYEGLGYFSPSNGIVQVEDGIAEIYYTAPDEDEAGPWENLKIRARLNDLIHEDNYIELTLQLGADFNNIWAEPNFVYTPEKSKIAIIPGHPDFPALLSGRILDDENNPLGGKEVEFKINNESKGYLWNKETDETGQKVTAFTNDDGTASVYYIYNQYERTKEKYIQKIKVTDVENSKAGILTVEAGLGLRVYQTEKYRSSGGLISPGTKVDLVQYISSDFHPGLDVRQYASDAYLSVWEDLNVELGFWYELEWISKPDSWWGVADDVTYKGRCSFDKLDDKTVLYALDQPRDDISTHSFTQFIPNSEGHHMYFAKAWLTNVNSNIRTSNISIAFNYRILTTNVSVDHWVSEFLCSFNPTDKAQILLIMRIKLIPEIGDAVGTTLDAIDFACKLSQGNYFEALFVFWSKFGGDYIENNYDKFKKYLQSIDGTKHWSDDELRWLLWAKKHKNTLDNIKNGFDLYWAKNFNGVNYYASPYTDFNWWVPSGSNQLIEKSGSINNTDETGRYRELLDFVLATNLAIYNERMEGARGLTILNANNIKLEKKEDQSEPVLIDFEDPKPSSYMYIENEFDYEAQFTVGDTIKTTFISGENTFVAIYNEGDKGYKLFDASPYPDVSCRITFDNSENEVLEIDANNDGNFETTVQAEIVGEVNSGGSGNVNLTVDWYKSIGGSGSDYEEDICTDSQGNTYLLARFEDGPVNLTGNSINYYPTEDNFTALIKFSPEGEMEWYKTFERCYPYGGLAVDSDGNIYAGLTVRDNSFIAGSNEINFQGGILIKYDSNGANGIANNLISGPGISIYDIEIDKSDNIFIAGSFAGSAIAGGNQFNAGVNDDDWFLAKYNSERTFQWLSTGQSTGRDYLYNIKAIDNNILFDGSFDNSVSFNNNNYSKQKENERFIGRADSQGNIKWIHFIKSDQATSISPFIKTSDNFQVFLRSPGSGEMYLNNQLLPGSEGYDMFYMEIDLSGSIERMVMYKQDGDQYIRDVTSGNGNNILLAGRFSETIWESESQDDAGSFDGFIVCFDSIMATNKYIQTLSIPGNNTLDVISYDYKNNRVMSAGDFSSDFVFNRNNVFTNGVEDIFLICYQEDFPTIVEKELLSFFNEEIINVYPNPAAEIVNIQVDHDFANTKYRISIWDINGKMLDVIKDYGENVNSGLIKYNTSDFKNGIYMIVFDDSNRRIVKKLLISK